MDTKEYSKREIDMMIAEIHTTVNSILVQTMKTNGRVTKNELDINTLRGDNKALRKSIVWGASLIGAIVIPVLGYAYFQSQDAQTAQILNEVKSVIK